MVRAKYNPGELDSVYQIEQGILQALELGDTAEVAVKAIDKVYEMPDAGEILRSEQLTKSALALCKRKKLTFDMQGDVIAFRKAASFGADESVDEDDDDTDD